MFYLVGLREQLFKTIVSDPIFTIHNDNNFSRERLYIPNNLFKRGGGGNLPLHPHFRRKWDAPDPLRPSLDIGLGMIYIIILHYA